MTSLAKPKTAQTIQCDQTSVVVPDYLEKTYRWAYLNPKTVPWLSSQPVVETILWGNAGRLIQKTVDEIENGQSVLQAAAVYGRFSTELAKKIGPTGRLDVIDVAPIQVETAKKRVAGYENTQVMIGDATIARPEQYDTVICFFLLHEVPEDVKSQVVTALLASAKHGGKVVFVDYHKPRKGHPLKLVMSKIFDWLEPFAKGLWIKEIEEYSDHSSRFTWQKEKIFGGLYQKVVVHKK